MVIQGLLYKNVFGLLKCLEAEIEHHHSDPFLPNTITGQHIQIYLYGTQRKFTVGHTWSSKQEFTPDKEQGVQEEFIPASTLKTIHRLAEDRGWSFNECSTVLHSQKLSFMKLILQTYRSLRLYLISLNKSEERQSLGCME